jgi:hypothetical protein
VTPTSTPFYAPSNGTQLYFNDDTRQCLSVLGGSAAQGAPVALTDCFSAVDPYIDLQLWNLTRGVTHVRLVAAPGLCLNFGSSPADGGAVKVGACVDVPQQTFYYTADNQLAIYNGGACAGARRVRALTDGCADQCLDVQAGSQPVFASPYGSLANVQSWACTTNDTQQVSVRPPEAGMRLTRDMPDLEQHRLRPGQYSGLRAGRSRDGLSIWVMLSIWTLILTYALMHCHCFAVETPAHSHVRMQHGMSQTSIPLVLFNFLTIRNTSTRSKMATGTWRR